MQSPLVSITLVVRNGEKYIHGCLQSVRAQTYKNCELTVLDNSSTDATRDIIAQEFPEFRVVAHQGNTYFGPGQNMCMPLTRGKYILGLCADVVLDPHFVERAVSAMEEDPKIGALQAKIFQIKDGSKTDSIDTTGFVIYKSRRIVNRGHGEKDEGKYEKKEEVFSYEGAVPFWRRTALEESAVWGEAHDEDYVWYADDIDLGWRMRLFGWKSVYDPTVIAYHDRSTTKRLSGNRKDFIAMRKELPARKKMLDWQNQHFTFIKNDLFVSAVKDLPYVLPRELAFFAYIVIFEPYTLRAIPHMLRMLPRMVRKRRYIMRHKKASRAEMEQWFLQ